MNIFSDRSGRAVVVPDVGFPLTLNLEGWPGGQSVKAAVTSLGLSAAGNYQFLHTLRNYVYVYVFGDRVSEISVGGVAFAGDCDRPGTPSGVELLWDYYQKHKITARGTPVGIAIGSRMSFQGFLVGFNFNATDPQFGLAQWNLKLFFHPPEG